MTDRSRHDELRAPQSWCGTNDCPPDDRCDVCALLDELAAAELERDLAVERAKDDKLVADSARRAAKRAARLPKTGMISAVQKVVQLQDALAAAEARAADAEHGRELARLDTEREREDTAAERARADRLTQALERIACGEYADTAEDAARAALAAQPDGTPCQMCDTWEEEDGTPGWECNPYGCGMLNETAGLRGSPEAGAKPVREPGLPAVSLSVAVSLAERLEGEAHVLEIGVPGWLLYGEKAPLLREAAAVLRALGGTTR